MQMRSIIAAAVLAGFFTLPQASAQQTTAEWSTESFEEELQQALGERADGVDVPYAFVASVSEDIQKAVATIADATDYIAEKLCGRRSRPTKLTLHLTAGFDLVFSGETGSQVEWDLETVCPRMEQ
ncbi:hypothetical protein [Chelativorans alearense]|uniref:hypothetical protein n=1 Tax=Chelativorans alearense TaxID=2681495 RepID=UPI0013D07452|nr:hypothetical protein [Chelativorans alearense]